MTSLPRFCGQCGAEWQSEGERFCANCGRERNQPLVAPPAAASAGAAYPIALPRPYISVANRSTWTLIFLMAFGAILMASFVSTVMEIQLLQRISDGEPVSLEEVESNDNRQIAIGLVLLAALAATVISFCLWIYRSASNLDALQANNRRFTPGWSVGWWFIPFMNLVRPYQVVKEIWRGSYPVAPTYGPEGDGHPGWMFAPISPAIGWWWGTWLTSGLVNYLVTRTISNDESSVDSVIDAQYFSLAGDALTFIATVLLFLLVKRITANQETKYLSLRNPATS